MMGGLHREQSYGRKILTSSPLKRYSCTPRSVWNSFGRALASQCGLCQFQSTRVAAGNPERPGRVVPRQPGGDQVRARRALRAPSRRAGSPVPSGIRDRETEQDREALWPLSAEEHYIGVDVEVDGPVPGLHSMLSLGASAYNAWGQRVGKFLANLETLPDATTDVLTMAWWKAQPEAWKRAGECHAATAASGKSPITRRNSGHRA